MRTIFRKIALILLVVVTALNVSAQQPGDTIFVKTLNYNSTTRDTMISFPSSNLTFEKIIMKYNMRCKDALVSTQSAPNQGCGEWDYSCNTWIVDSSKIEEVLSTHPSHIISNFSGNTFYYSNNSIYDYYKYSQITVSIDSVISESLTPIGGDTTSVYNLLKGDEKSGKTQIIYRASELLAAGFSIGTIDGLLLDVTNSGGLINFLKINMKHTTDSILQSNNVSHSGFTNVYNNSFTFNSGSNRIPFYNSFIWDGVSNIIIEFSFTNTSPSNPIIFSGTASPYISNLSANNNFAIDLSSNGLVDINTTYLNTINSEISVGFRSYGIPALLPVKTSILYGYSSNINNREINIHLPWSNGIVYFDCGFSGNYDRIDKQATPQDYEGMWNYWVFTKNATSGIMKIYLNGSLWHSGTGKTKTTSILNLLLGNNSTMTSNYKGKVNELSIWNKELSQSDIALINHQEVTPAHPSYSNLVAYYKMNEGSGQNVNDSKNNVNSLGSNLKWTFDRGADLEALFSESSIRPNITFASGVYNLDTTHYISTDSIIHISNIVNVYSIIPAASGSNVDDIVNLDTIRLYYQANYSYTYDGELNTILDSVQITTDDSIHISDLNYYKRYPFYNEIMSFVTPYGKGLDLGVSGKTWYFDVTDFKPLLQGNKRMKLNGGIWQEELDIEFMFIVGTPPRDVLEFNQLWQGSIRKGSASIASINSDTRYPSLSVPLLSNGQYFKIRSTITGHGNEGEFRQNGGLINHYFSANSSSNSFSWNITEECSDNPIFPQGGTWVYDREGWCPGKYSYLKEMDISSLVTAGSNAVLDYNCSSPPVSTGSYKYLVAIQLVTYGAPNHTLDANLVNVLAPTNKTEYSRHNPICAKPVIVIQNTGSTTLTNVEISYWINNASTKQSFTWTGNLGFLESEEVELPIGTLWQNDYAPSDNVFHAELTKANGVVDNYSFNNVYNTPFLVTETTPQRFIVEIKTNNYPNQNSYKIVDEAGNTISGTSNLTLANTVYRDTLDLNGCYTLIMEDLGNDGLQWWANSAQGSGYVRLRKDNGSIFKNFESDFGYGFEYSFTATDVVSVEEIQANYQIDIYPNPTSDKLYISAKGIDKYELLIFDLLGKQIEVSRESSENSVVLNLNGLSKGVYLISIIGENKTMVKRIIVQ